MQKKPSSPRDGLLKGSQYRKSLMGMLLIPYLWRHCKTTWAEWFRRKRDGRKPIMPSEGAGRSFAGDEVLLTSWWYLTSKDGYDESVDDPLRKEALAGYSGRVADLKQHLQKLRELKSAVLAVPDVKVGIPIEELDRLIAIASRPKRLGGPPIDHRTYLAVLLVDHLESRCGGDKLQLRRDQALDLLAVSMTGTQISMASLDRARVRVDDWVNRRGDYSGIPQVIPKT